MSDDLRSAVSTPRADASLTQLSQSAVGPVSMQRTCLARALHVEAIDANFDDPARPGAKTRDGVDASYDTARNTLSVIIGSLPERLIGDAIQSINRAEAIRIGRIAPIPEEQESAHDSASRRIARPHPVSNRISY